MKFIKKIINKVKLKYYNHKLSVCDMALEQALIEDNEMEHDFWLQRYNMYLDKFREVRKQLEIS